MHTWVVVSGRVYVRDRACVCGFMHIHECTIAYTGMDASALLLCGIDLHGSVRVSTIPSKVTYCGHWKTIVQKQVRGRDEDETIVRRGVRI